VKVLMVSKPMIASAYRTKAEGIARHPDVDLTVVVPPYWRDDAGRRAPLEPGHDAGYRLVVEPMAFNGHFHYHFYPTIHQVFRRVRPDLLHMDEEAYNLATWQGFALARMTGAKALFFTWQNLHRRYPPPISWMEDWVHRSAVGAMCGNAESVDVLRGKGYRGRTWVIPQFGVDPALFTPDPEAQSRPRPFTVGFAGRLRERKGAHLLVEAVAQLGGDARLEILGWGEEEPRVRALAADRGLGDRFQLRPGVPSDQVPAFLQQLDVAVMPSIEIESWKEQFGRVLVEAMACGVNVVGSNSGEIAHVIADAGLVFPPGDATALADCLRRLRDDEALRADLREKGLRRVRGTYTQQSVADQTVAAYREVLADGGR
jgi:glycosyltransferase involved in cell wall biosynthesis